jgi:hypothetical protein
MPGGTPIADDELLLRHVPGGPAFQQPPGPRITSLNFKLRPGETGVSVTRAAVTPPAALLAVVGGNPAAGSKVAAARAGDVRALGLEVVPDPTAADPGHAVIRSGTASLASQAVRRALAQVFQFVDPSPPGGTVVP